MIARAPTSASWLNAVEGFFAKLSRRKLQRGVFHSVVALQTAINDFVEQHNQSPTPFVWRADPKDVIEDRKRALTATLIHARSRTQNCPHE